MNFAVQAGQPLLEGRVLRVCDDEVNQVVQPLGVLFSRLGQVRARKFLQQRKFQQQLKEGGDRGQIQGGHARRGTRRPGWSGIACGTMRPVRSRSARRALKSSRSGIACRALRSGWSGSAHRALRPGGPWIPGRPGISLAADNRQDKSHDQNCCY